MIIRTNINRLLKPQKDVVHNNRRKNNRSATNINCQQQSNQNFTFLNLITFHIQSMLSTKNH